MPNMNRWASVLSLLLIVLGLLISGCEGGYAIKKRSLHRINEAISNLELGMTKSEVKAKLGTPAQTAAETSQGGKIIDKWYFETSGRYDVYSGYAVDINYTVLVFENGKLVMWGKDKSDEMKAKLEVLHLN